MIVGGALPAQVTKTCVWKVGKIPADGNPVLTGRLAASPDTDAKGESITVQLRFKVIDASVSGLRIDKLNLTNERYKARPPRALRLLSHATPAAFCRPQSRGPHASHHIVVVVCFMVCAFLRAL